MKTVNIKKGFCALLALPVVVLRCLLACADCCLAACDMKLRCGVWPEPDNVPETPGHDKEYDIDCIVRFLATRPDSDVMHFRQGCEDTPIGHDVVRCPRDRHLYAVLVPTKAENLQRIRNILSAMDSESVRICRERGDAI